MAPYEDYLMHYGVKGMKWGHRRYHNADGSLNRAGIARQDFKDAKQARRVAAKGVRKSGLGIGIKGIAKYDKAKAKFDKADMDYVTAKANFKAAKAKNAEKAAKAEFKTYKKEMAKTGLAGSAADQQSGGRSTKIYNEMKAKKGKAYADKVQKRVQNEAYATFAAGAAVAIGSQVAMAILENRS